LKYYIVYKITNLINGNFYIGAHIGKKPKDGYMGGGKRLWEAIRYYGGFSNFKKEILFILDDEESMWDKERELVNEEFIAREDTYNMALGGKYDTGNMRRKKLIANETHWRSPRICGLNENYKHGDRYKSALTNSN
jgi:hypothetical protein